MKRTAQVRDTHAGITHVKATAHFSCQPMPWFIQGAFHYAAFLGLRLPKYRTVIGRSFGNRPDYLNRLQGITESITEESITHKSGGRRPLAANLL